MIGGIGLGFVECCSAWFCLFCCEQGGIWNTLRSSADEHKWLWAVYVVVLLLPILLLSICFCPRSGPVKVFSVFVSLRYNCELSLFQGGATFKLVLDEIEKNSKINPPIFFLFS